jgi:hypothetical protein
VIDEIILQGPLYTILKLVYTEKEIKVRARAALELAVHSKEVSPVFQKDLYKNYFEGDESNFLKVKNPEEADYN